MPVNVASNVVAVAAGNLHSLFVTADGMLWAMGLNTYGQLGNGIDEQHQPRRQRGEQCGCGGGGRESFAICDSGRDALGDGG